MMQPDLAFYLVTSVVLILLVVLTCWLWRGGKAAPAPAATRTPRATRDPKPFAGLTRKPWCEACEQGAGSHLLASGAPPPRMTFTRGRRRHVDTTEHFCPHATCSYYSRVDWGNIRANGHPGGRRWRQLVCLGC